MKENQQTVLEKIAELYNGLNFPISLFVFKVHVYLFRTAKKVN